MVSQKSLYNENSLSDVSLFLPNRMIDVISLIQFHDPKVVIIPSVHPPLSVTTTRIFTFLVDPKQPSLSTITACGVDPKQPSIS